MATLHTYDSGMIRTCPACGAVTDVTAVYDGDAQMLRCTCKTCGYEWQATPLYKRENRR